MNFSKKNHEYKKNNRNIVTKTRLTIIMALLIAVTSFAQNGINYKAIVKDGNSNILASSPVTIQFIVYEGVALTNNVYQESHTINTDANGLIIVDIGEGTTSDTFTDINWSDDEHYLNVKADTGNGLVDLGTTQFKTVPYAITARDAINVANHDHLGETWTSAPNESLTINGNSNILGSALTVSNSGSSTAIRVPSSGGDGIIIGPVGDDAIDINSPADTGVFISYSGTNGVQVNSAGNNGVQILEPNNNGIQIDSPGNVGVGISNSENIGMTIYDSAYEGIFISNSGSDGISIFNTVDDGIEIRNTGGNGVDIDSPNGQGIQIGSAGGSGIEIISPSNNGINIDSAGNHGIYITNSEDYGIVVGAADLDGIITFSANRYGGYFSGTKSGVYAESNNDANPDIILGGTSVSNTGDNGVIASDPDYSGSDIFLRSNDAVVVQLDVDENELGQFEVRNGSNSVVFHVNDTGNANLTGSLTQNSDKRLKKDITDLPYGLNEILQLQPKAYNWKSREEEHKSLGLIAQEVRPIIKEIVNTSDDEMKTLGISYTELIPVLINAIKEQQNLIKNLKKERQTGMSTMLERIEKLEALNNQ